MDRLKDLFLLNPEVAFLNHGSFGAVPRPVFRIYQEWQRELERQPVQFLARDLVEHLTAARRDLARFLNAEVEDLVYIPNVTYGVNLVARSLPLEPGDEVLTTNHEYGACDYVWTFVTQKRGAGYNRRSIALFPVSSEDFLDQFWQGVTGRTRVIYLSHITSPTALQFPIEEVCNRAREAGILTVVDGAHAPGQIPVDLGAIGADFYIGNCHKWMMAPKGAGFLHTRRDSQHLVEPLVVSWGWADEPPFKMGSRYLEKLHWHGTIDPSAYLSVPAAIQFQFDHDWEAVRARCRELVVEAVRRIGKLTGLASPAALGATRDHQMATVSLPAIEDLPDFQARLYERYRVEVPCIQWEGGNFIRVSVQGYNSEKDIDRLIAALGELLPR